MKKTRWSVIGLGALLGLVAASVAHAADMGEVVVTADRMDTPSDEITADTTVITREDIEQSGAVTVAELLRRVAAVEVTTAGGPGKATSLFLRGTNPGHTLVLIDGLRVGSATLGQFDWANLSLNGIERIEIVRGPQSSLYGADAIGGVIQIFTRSGSAENHARVLVETGDLGSSRVSAGISGGNEAGIRYGLHAEAQRTRGVSAAAVGTEADSFSATNWGGKLEVPMGDGQIRIFGHSNDGSTGLDGFDPATFTFGDILNFNQRLRQQQWGLEAEYPVGEAWTTLLRLGRSQDVYATTDPVTAFNNAYIRTRIDQLSWENRFHFEAIDALLGIEQHRDLGQNLSMGINRRMDQTAGFASLAWHHDAFDVSAALRQDRNNIVADKMTYRLGLAVHPFSGIKLFANYGTGFKAPSLNDLYWPATVFSAGNPNLRPESSKGTDVGLSWNDEGEWGRLSASATWFSQDIRDLISWEQVKPFFWQPTNIGRAKVHGWEFSLDYHFGPGYVRGNWTVQRARNALDGTWLPRRAREKGGFGIGMDGGRWGFDAWWAIVGPRFSSPGNISPMQGYDKLDMRAWVEVVEHVRLLGRVENATNQRYEEVAGYGVMPRIWYVGVEGRY